MSETLKQNKVRDLIKAKAAQFLQEESNRTSLITVTDVFISNDLKKATIFVTVFPETQEESVINFLKRKRSGFKNFIKNETKIGRIPFFDFAIDKGEKNRQRIDEISKLD
ncbi:hypothetical protein A3I18_01420 [Candidatus Campbellbacteria bacterium RIFCSPLOWO2_02_FULL_35_11]|uniref:Ribosome-binding factor A n=2 Tax=Candidatus Campbelliibacteriota TaxID=1752727 RepID=A0A1F5EL31_9BACT|nr:MAG: hypothetical protein A3E89_00470 [Candidatus Campbellbacteria bacterium RIFCSPHIGHO2_12_FULL_35_10]OGD70314.1 MAG: hypothetical protein A3I18_01420 [Candidatus Campbellbacteria bacterium RIFCSPLOWO2_02_FULL_35_11]